MSGTRKNSIFGPCGARTYNAKNAAPDLRHPQAEFFLVRPVKAVPGPDARLTIPARVHIWIDRGYTREELMEDGRLFARAVDGRMRLIRHVSANEYRLCYAGMTTVPGTVFRPLQEPAR